MRNFITQKLESAKEKLDLSGVSFDYDNDELNELVVAINNKPVIKVLVLENSAISSQQAGILAKLVHVTSINLDRNDIGFSRGFQELCMNSTIGYLNFNRNALNTHAASFLLNDLKRDNLIIEIGNGNTFSFEETRQISRKYNSISEAKALLSNSETFKSKKNNNHKNDTCPLPKIECKIL